MHISEGVLSAPVLLAGFAISAAGTWHGIRNLHGERIMTTAVFAAVFFTASLVHVPVGPSSAHLLLHGVAGLVLGWAAFPALLTALLLQAVLFQFGGLTTLGVNTALVAVPAVLCHLALRGLPGRSKRATALAGFAAGSLSVLLTALLAALALALSGEEFLAAAWVVVAAHTPLMLVEGLITMFVVGFLTKVRPEILTFAGGSPPPPRGRV